MSDPAADRKAAASARQAKLLAKSQERLAKITGAAKGEGRVISDAAVGITPARPAAPPASLALIDDDPDEVDLALHAPPPSRRTASTSSQHAQAAQFEAMGMGSMFGGMGGAGGEGGGDMFAQMLASMGAGGPGGPGGMGAPGTSPFPNAPASPSPTTPRTLLDKLLPVLHLLAMVGLAAYAVGWLEPVRKFGLYGWMGVVGTVDWKAWSSLSGKAPREGLVGQLAGTALAEVPLFWLFITVELVLQTTRLFLLRNRPPVPGLISSVLPILSQFSPRAALLLQTLIRYIALISICLNDLAVLVFCIGAAVIVGKFKAGAQGGFVEKVFEAGGVGWNAARGEL